MALVKALARASFLAPRAVEKTAIRGHKHYAASLPVEKISRVENIILKSAIVAGVMAYPFWVIFHIQEYKGDRSED